MSKGMIGRLQIPGGRCRNHKALRIDGTGTHEQFPVQRACRRIERSRDQDQLYALTCHLHKVRGKAHIKADRQCCLSEFGVKNCDLVSRCQHIGLTEPLAAAGFSVCGFIRFHQ